MKRARQGKQFHRMPQHIVALAPLVPHLVARVVQRGLVGLAAEAVAGAASAARRQIDANS
eukprot:1917252-Alexandrium_andersonii.AAC.2